MDKNSRQEYAVLLDDAAALLVTMAGNLQNAEEMIRETDREREYNRRALHWSAGDVVDILQRFQILRLDFVRP